MVIPVNLREPWLSNSSFPTAQFHKDCYTIYRRGRNENGGGLLHYVRNDVPSACLEIYPNFEKHFMLS